jgi:hypothetical protein
MPAASGRIVSAVVSHESEGTGRGDDYWDVLARALPVVAILLPVIGAGIRWLNFAFDSTIPSQVVVAASIPELAITGFRPFLTMIPIAALMGFFLFTDRRIMKSAGSPTGPPRPRWGSKVILPLAVVAMVAAVWVGGLLTLISGLGPAVAGYLTARIGARPSVGLTDAIPVVLVLSITACLTSGLAPTTTRAAFIRFNGSQGLTDGWYLPLGTTEQGWYLRACAGDQRVLFVKRETLDLINFSEHTSVSQLTSVADILRGQPVKLGFVSQCAD